MSIVVIELKILTLIVDIKDGILYLAKERGLSWGTCNLAVSSIRFFYKVALRRGHDNFYLPFSKKPQHLPEILTKVEIKRLFSATKNHKHHAIFMTVYSAGLRASEVAHLTVKDIDSDAGVICVRQGKGRKDRYVPLSARLLDELRQYWKKYKPGHWLFPGRDGKQPITCRGIQDAFRKNKEKAQIIKLVSIHSLRHAFATHLLESGTEIISIKQLLGHSSISTTLRYARLSKKRISDLGSPLDSL